MKNPRPLALLLALIWPACRASPPPSEAVAAPTRLVRLSAAAVRNAELQVIRLSPGALSPQVRMPATIAADPQLIARIGAQHTGRVVGIAVRLGDQVRPGQALLSIDSVDVHHVSSEYLTALARLREVEDSLTRQQQLTAEHIGVVADLRRAEAAAAALQATLRETEEHLHFLGLTQEAVAALREGRAGELHSILRAPIAGRIEAMRVTLGQVLAGQEDVLTIMHLARVWATLRLNERDLAAVRLGASVRLSLSSYPERVFVGQVDSISDLVDPATRTVEARATVDNPERLLKPGMSAVASIVRAGSAAGLWLPAAAILQQRGGQWAFVRQSAGSFLAQPVQVGAEMDGLVPVQAGLQAEAEVVVQGALTLWGELERRALEASP